MHTEQIEVRATFGKERVRTLAPVEVPDSVTEAVTELGEGAAMEALRRGLLTTARTIAHAELKAAVLPEFAARTKVVDSRFIELPKRQPAAHQAPGRRRLAQRQA